MKKWIINILIKILWKLSDDAMFTVEYVSDYYDNVPDNIKYETFKKWEFHFYKSIKRKECLEWLNKGE